MSKVSLKLGIVGCTLICVAAVLIFGACIKPVSLERFLEDELDITDGETGDADVDMGFENPADNAPALEWDNEGTWTPLDENDTVDAQGFSSITVRVINADDYDVIEWHCNGFSDTVDDGVFTMNIAGFPFGVEDVYSISVTGTTADGASYGILFYIAVEN